MAIDDNASYELTGYQVKDLAQKIRAKADASAISAVGYSNLYSDLTGTPSIPTVYNGTLTIQQNGTELGTFSANQSSDTTINITGGGGADRTKFYWSSPNFYKDYLFQTTASWDDVEDAWDKGMVIVGDGDVEYLITSLDDTELTLTAQYTYYAGSSVGFQDSTIVRFIYNYPGWTKTVGPNAFTGATSSVAGTSGFVPTPAAGDENKVLHGDGTWKDATAKLVEMSYGESNSWAKFIAAYNAGSIVYCRASSNANPATGSQTRKAFMAYVNNATSPTSVEFQYVRSVSSKSASQPVDQVFVYTLTNSNGGTWSVATRDMAPKIAAGNGINVSYSNGTYTISLAS